jgi:adenine-specific DNA methylase
MLLSLLLPDPCDPQCPEDFKTNARHILSPVPGHVGNSDEGLREALLRFIGDFANWNHATNPTFLEACRSLVESAHPDETPLFVDPFAGGGSIPLEALREAAAALEEFMGTNRAEAPIPTESLPPVGTLGFRVQRYGMTERTDLFAARQNLALVLLSTGIAATEDSGIQEALGLLLSRVADRNSALCTWRPQADQEKVEHVFARQALPPVWDFAEAVVNERGNWWLVGWS